MMIFADDAKFYKKINTLREVKELKEDLMYIEQWFGDLLIKLNPKKGIQLSILEKELKCEL